MRHSLKNRVCGRRMRLPSARTKKPDRLFNRQIEDLGDISLPQAVFQHRRLKAPALALLADRGHASHHPEVGVDDARTVARRTRTLGIRAEQSGLHAIRLRERLANWLERIGVRRRIAPPR